MLMHAIRPKDNAKKTRTVLAISAGELKIGFMMVEVAVVLAVITLGRLPLCRCDKNHARLCHVSCISEDRC
jgi:hypothetical protein